MTAISIDVGTTTIKAVGYDDLGREHAMARLDVAVERPQPGWAEQDMDAVWQAVRSVVVQVAARLPTPPDHLALTAQGDGAWLVDGAGRPTGPAILWNDGRAHAEVSGWDLDGVLDEAFAINGSRVTTGMPNALLAWLGRHDGDRVRRSATLLTCGGWIFSCLTGRLVVDESDASAPFLDIRRREWSDQLLDLFGLGDASRLLPDLVRDDDRVGDLTADVAADLGLPPGLPVVLAPYDICATAIGAGAVLPGDALCILGTTLCAEVVTDRVDTSTPVGVTVTLGAPGRWIRAFPTMAGGDVLRWSAAMLGVEDVQALFALAATGGPGNAGVRFLPYLSPAGERNPFFDPGARGALTGLSLDAHRGDVARAVVEGLTFTIRECLEAAPSRPVSLSLCGGGTASPGWRQLIADVTGLNVLVGPDREVGARGALLTALVATGLHPSLEAAAMESATAVPAVDGDRHAPSPDRYDELDASYLAFKQLRETLRKGRS